MNTILNSGGIKDAIGVLFVVITGLLYATGVTETATDVGCDVGLDEWSVGAAVEVPQGASARSSSVPHSENVRLTDSVDAIAGR